VSHCIAAEKMAEDISITINADINNNKIIDGGDEGIFIENYPVNKEILQINKSQFSNLIEGTLESKLVLAKDSKYVCIFTPISLQKWDPENWGNNYHYPDKANKELSFDEYSAAIQWLTDSTGKTYKIIFCSNTMAHRFNWKNL